MKNNNKKFIVSILVIVLFIGSYFLITNYNKPNVVLGEKEIEIVIKDYDDNIVHEEIFFTDQTILGDLLDEINLNKKEDIFLMEGSKNSDFGRFITEIVYFEKSTNDFWVYSSDNNEACQREPFCPGVDVLPIETHDKFEFNILNP